MRSDRTSLEKGIDTKLYIVSYIPSKLMS